MRNANAHDMLFRVLADPTRRAIFERLCRDGEQTVGALTARAKVSQPAVSKHLGILRQAGLVRDRHEGRQTHYSAQRGALAPLIDWTSKWPGSGKAGSTTSKIYLEGWTNEQTRDRNAFRHCRTRSPFSAGKDLARADPTTPD